MNLGYNKLSQSIKSSGLVDDFAKKMNNLTDYVPMSDMLLEIMNLIKFGNGRMVE